MKATTAIFVTWDELDEFLKKWGKETFGEECLCESGSADESWSIQISFQTSFLTDQRNESALRDINERYKSLIEQYGSEDDAPEDGGYPVTKDSSAQLTLEPSQHVSEQIVGSKLLGYNIAQSMLTYHGVIFFVDKVLN